MASRLVSSGAPRILKLTAPSLFVDSGETRRMVEEVVTTRLALVPREGEVFGLRL